MRGEFDRFARFHCTKVSICGLISSFLMKQPPTVDQVGGCMDMYFVFIDDKKGILCQNDIVFIFYI